MKMRYVQLENTLAQYNSIMSGREIKVSMTGENVPPHTDNDKVYVPLFVQRKADNDILFDGNGNPVLDAALIHAANNHELCHVMFTGRKYAQTIKFFTGSKKEIETKAKLLNVIEDGRIETLFTAEYSGNEHVFLKTLMDYVLKHTDENEDDSAKLVGYLLVIGRAYTPVEVRAKMRERALDASDKATVQKMESLVMQFVLSPYNVQEAKETVEELYALIVNSTQQQEQQEQQEGQPGNQAESGENKAPGDSNGEPGESGTDAQNADNKAAAGKPGGSNGGGEAMSPEEALDALKNAVEEIMKSINNGHSSCDNQNRGNTNSDAKEEKLRRQIRESGSMEPTVEEALSDEELRKFAEELEAALGDQIAQDLDVRMIERSANQDSSDESELRATNPGFGSDRCRIEYKEHRITEQMTSLKGEIDREFEKLISAKQAGYIYQESSGSLDMNVVMYDDYDITEAYRRWEDNDEDAGSIEIVFLADASGSMNSVYKTLGKSVWLMQESVRGIDNQSDFSAVYFDEYPSIPPSFPRKGNYIAPETGGCTDPYGAIVIARNRLMKSAAKHRLLFIMTDGSWSRAERSNELLMQMMGEDIKVIGYQYGRAAQSFSANVMVRSHQLSGMVEVVKELVEDILSDP